MDGSTYQWRKVEWKEKKKQLVATMIIIRTVSGGGVRGKVPGQEC